MGLRGQNSPGGPFVLCLWLVLWSSRCPQVLMPQKSNKNKENRPLFKRKTVDLWSCWADLNRRPHPYQLTKGCCCLSFAILSCCRQSIVPQCFQGFFAAPYSLLSYLKKYCFLMPVSVLCRFLLETATSDLIPTHAILRPIRAAFLCSVRRIHELQRPGHSRGV